ncbi:alpha/beta fold hydrolase [Parasphingopyxis algicola]|uniref:alpha/beta fold hydrolase BchO n=1 Tax=Parasphingopyxis algicola TaxID=2026624 RepID=UPI0015A41F6C|nr:alpha/beta fold hydrolase BchO [Parasphingopyxis algicola]QLC24797.1 alpha/beta fold hydrolase [Parasphingopyxis algicola]
MTTPPHWETDGRDWPNREASRFVEAAGLRWHVQTMGTGPLLLMLHGTGAATHSWRALAPLLAEHFSVVAPDLPGHGFTSGRPRSGVSLPAVAGALKELLDALDAEPAMTVGHSAGAAIAIQLSLDRAADGPIVAFNPALLPFPGLAAKLFPAMAKMLFVNPFAPRIFAGVARRSGEVERFLARSTGSRIDGDGVRDYTRLLGRSGHVDGAIGMMANWDLETLKRRLPEVSAPILLAHGTRDTAVPPSAMREAAALISDAEIEMLDGLGHLAHEERPDLAAALVRRFAADHAIGNVVDTGAG